MAKSGLSRQKNLRFWIFPRVRVLIHTRRHLGEGFRKFSAKNNDKIWSYAPKTAKWQKIDYKVRAGRPISWPKTLILNFLMSTGSHMYSSRNLEIDFWKGLNSTNFVIKRINKTTFFKIHYYWDLSRVQQSASE